MNSSSPQENQKLDIVVEAEATIEALDDNIHDLTPEEMNRVVSGLSTEAMELRRARKSIRYKLYRCKTEAEGKCASEVDGDFKKQFEESHMFGGWRFFGVTWDVAFADPYRIVHKDKSEVEEWEELVAAKFPTVINGRVIYPDITVRDKVEKEAIDRGLI